MELIILILFSAILLAIVFSLIFTTYSDFYPEIVQINDKFYVRKWCVTEWGYLDNGAWFKYKFWWTGSHYLLKYASFDSIEDAKQHYSKLYPKLKVKRVKEKL